MFFGIAAWQEPLVKTQGSAPLLPRYGLSRFKQQLMTLMLRAQQLKECAQAPRRSEAAVERPVKVRVGLDSGSYLLAVCATVGQDT